MKLLDFTIIQPTATTPVTLLPFACVHEDNEGHSPTKWAEFLYEVKTTPNAYAIGLGDYMDWLRTHAREFLRMYPHDRDSFKTLHDYRKKAADTFCEKYLDPIRSKLIGLSLGNHHHEFEDGLNDTMYMCQQLKVPYLSKGFFLRLNFRAEKEPTPHHSLIVLGHHGEGIGSGSTMGGDVNAMENKSKGFEADIYIFSHNHKKHGFHVEPITIPRKGPLKLVDRPKAFIRTGCFMKGYVSGCVTYAEAKLMNPTAIGYVRLDVKFKSLYDPNRYLVSKLTGKKHPSKTTPLQYEFKITH